MKGFHLAFYLLRMAFLQKKSSLQHRQLSNVEIHEFLTVSIYFSMLFFDIAVLNE